MKVACKNIDRLATVMIRPRPVAGGVPQPDMAQLYRCAKGRQPISFDISKALLDRRGGTIGILTGIVIPGHLPRGENDGPLGSVALCRALEMLGADVRLLSEDELVEVIQSLAQAIGCNSPVYALSESANLGFSDLVDELDVAIAIEKIGVNEKGKLHSVTGLELPGPPIIAVDKLIDQLNSKGKLTISIGDGGNEVGFGSILKEARKVIEHGEVCRCGCGGGIVSVTPTAHLYPVSISNWGAYALVAALAVCAERSDITLKADEERTLLELAASLDCRDGGTGAARFAVDGVSGKTSMAFVQMLQDIVEVRLREPKIRPF